MSDNVVPHDGACTHGVPMRQHCAMCELDSAVMNGEAAPHVSQLSMRPGDIARPTADGWVVVPRWSPRWVLYKLHMRLISVLDYLRELRFYWRNLKIGAKHGRESPGCGASRARLELRFDPIRGEHVYCTGCLRPVHFFASDTTAR